MPPTHRLVSASLIFTSLPKPRIIPGPRHPLYRCRMASTSVFGLKESSLIHNQAYIDGKWVSAKEGGVIKVTNPATTEELGTVPELGLEETKQAIDAASKALKTWSKTTAKTRHDILMKWYALMCEHSDDLARLIGENAYGTSFIEWFAEEAVRTHGEVVPSAFMNIRNVVVKQPISTSLTVLSYLYIPIPVSILTPWNFPSAMITRKLGAALAAGCTAVIKPPTETPCSALVLVEALYTGISRSYILVHVTYSTPSLVLSSPRVRVRFLPCYLHYSILTVTCSASYLGYR
ncbi:Aldehyde/histidinol dehydrogenase [Dichomitus squalens]|nr:Aldehyde/histidinol dehydrogenase [Dichomitus squalens]